MANLTQVFLVLLFFQLSGSCSATRNLAFSMYHMNFTSGEKDIFSELKYRYYNENRKVSVFVEFKLKENVTNYMLKASVDMLRGDNRLINLNKIPMDGCQFGKLIQKSSNSLIGFFFREMRRRSNIPMYCPLLENKLYYVRNYTLSPDTFPFPVIKLSLTWVVQMKYFVSRKDVGTLLFQGKLYKI